MYVHLVSLEFRTSPLLAKEIRTCDEFRSMAWFNGFGMRYLRKQPPWGGVKLDKPVCVDLG